MYSNLRDYAGKLYYKSMVNLKLRLFAICLAALFVCSAIAEAQSFRNQGRRASSPRPTYTAPAIVEIEPRDCDVYGSLTKEEQEFIDELDKLRATYKFPRITLLPNIVEDSRRWSSHMKRVNRLYHGNSTQENAARGVENGLGVFRMWRSSPGHNAKLLNRNDTVGGIGKDGQWWTYRAARSAEDYYTGKDPESDLIVREITTDKSESAHKTGYNVVYRRVTGPLGIIERRVPVRVPVNTE